MADDEISVAAALGIYTASPDFLLQVLIEELKNGPDVDLSQMRKRWKW